MNRHQQGHPYRHPSTKWDSSGWYLRHCRYLYAKLLRGHEALSFHFRRRVAWSYRSGCWLLSQPANYRSLRDNFFSPNSSLFLKFLQRLYPLPSTYPRHFLSFILDIKYTPSPRSPLLIITTFFNFFFFFKDLT